MLEAKPYLLKNEIMNYAWGGRGNNAFIPKLLGLPVEQETPYAELWMGAHPKAPSVLVEEDSDLFKLTKEEPESVLGQMCLDKFGGKFPYLFKILSAGEALSIQAHPNKKQAEMLHAKDPKNYPDDNHKPEIAIALSSLTALVGFKSHKDLVRTFEDYSEIAEFVGCDLVLKFNACTSSEEQRLQLKTIYSAFMTRALRDPQVYQKAVIQLSSKLKGKSDLSDADILFLELIQKYGEQDVGLFALYFLNLVQLNSGEAVFLKAGIPHAYVKGNIIECMANSDNVVRAGLTPKFKDVETLVDILTYEMGEISKYKTSDSSTETVYNPPVDDFVVKQIQLEPEQSFSVENNKSPQIILVTEGEISLTWSSEKSLTVKQGNSVFIPSGLSGFVLKSEIARSQSFIAGV